MIEKYMNLVHKNLKTTFICCAILLNILGSECSLRNNNSHALNNTTTYACTFSPTGQLLLFSTTNNGLTKVYDPEYINNPRHSIIIALLTESYRAIQSNDC